LTVKLVLAATDLEEMRSTIFTSREYFPGLRDWTGIFPRTTTRCPEKN
jgi:hypothetical protein